MSERKPATEGGQGAFDRRTVLAGDRTIYAAERTYAAWVRTGLAALASGVGAKAALRHVVPESLILATGTLLVLFSAFCFAIAVLRELVPGPPPPEPDVRRIPASPAPGAERLPDRCLRRRARRYLDRADRERLRQP